MAFDVGSSAIAERAKPRWVKYVSPDGGVVVHVQLKPRDPAIVKALDAEFPHEERLTRGGRIRERNEEASGKWITGYLMAHVLDWDITEDGTKAPVVERLLDLLPKTMRGWMVDQTMADDLSAHEVESPFPSSPRT